LPPASSGAFTSAGTDEDRAVQQYSQVASYLTPTMVLPSETTSTAIQDQGLAAALATWRPLQAKILNVTADPSADSLTLCVDQALGSERRFLPTGQTGRSYQYAALDLKTCLVLRYEAQGLRLLSPSVDVAVFWEGEVARTDGSPFDLAPFEARPEAVLAAHREELGTVAERSWMIVEKYRIERVSDGAVFESHGAYLTESDAPDRLCRLDLAARTKAAGCSRYERTILARVTGEVSAVVAMDLDRVTILEQLSYDRPDDAWFSAGEVSFKRKGWTGTLRYSAGPPHFEAGDGLTTVDGTLEGP